MFAKPALEHAARNTIAKIERLGVNARFNQRTSQMHFPTTPQPSTNTVMARITLALLILLTACTPTMRVPPYAARPYEPLTRQAVVEIALREWRAFGSPVDPAESPDKPERALGLWQRVGDYWWLGLEPNDPEATFTGKHDAAGNVFPPEDDGDFAWSAAFVSYVMRMAGAGKGFPYNGNHHVYIRAALRGDAGLVIAAERPEAYAPQLGDLVCVGRAGNAGLRFDEAKALPAFKSHCDIVVSTTGPDSIGVIGGNVADTVALRHFPVGADGRLLDPDRYLAVLRLVLPPG